MLSKRLKSIFDFIGNDVKRRRFIDVGSDHGHLTCYALKYGGFLTSVSTDIHREPANRTEEFLNLNGLEDRSSVLCTDGLDGINLCEFDVVVMAGLGGNNIIDILSRVLKTTPIDILKTVTLILQPQKSHESLREFAFDNGFNIVDEDACEDRDIYYSYMKLVYDGIKRELGCVDKFYGPVLLKKANDKKNAPNIIAKEIFNYPLLLKKEEYIDSDNLVDSYKVIYRSRGVHDNYIRCIKLVSTFYLCIIFMGSDNYARKSSFYT